VQENVPLAPLTTLGVGGPARYFDEVESESDLIGALAFAEAHSLPLLLLGGGSNLVVADQGFPGLVVRLGLRGIADEREGDYALVTAGAGEDWDRFVRYCVEKDLAGVECLAGIPGLVGATPVQNVGAYGQEVAETLVRVRAYDRVERQTVDLSNADCRFGYRASRFNTTEFGRWVILSVTFALTPGGPPTLRYADLQRHFGAGVTPSLTEVYHGVRAIRARKGMVVDPDDPDSRSAGSFFKNPVVSSERFAALQAQHGDEIPHYPQPDGSIKVAAAWLIERAGFQRGQAFGSIGISTKHVLALVNRGGATAAEIVTAARRIQKGVSDTWGIRIVPEPIFVGFSCASELPYGATCSGVKSAR
jgi:UDP-N-acetylmuramate dehydrogenase